MRFVRGGELRLDGNHPTTEDPAGTFPEPEGAKRVNLPANVSLLRQKLGQKAKREGLVYL